MGAKESKYRELKLHELYEYAKVSGFTHEEIKQLYIYYQHFSTFQIDDGMINYAEFCEALGVKDSLVVQRIFKIFDENEDEMLNFREFLVGLTRLLYDTAEQKIKLSYRLFDINHKGYCTREEMAEVLRGCFRAIAHVHRQLPSEVIEDIIECSLQELSTTEGSDKVTYKDYMQWYYKHTSVSKWLSMDIERMKDGISLLYKAAKKAS